MRLLLAAFLTLHAIALQAGEFAVFGDAGHARPELEALKESILKEKINSIVLLGDQIYDTSKTYPQLWDNFKLAALNFKVVALGNHHISYQEEIKYFEAPGEYYTKEFSDEVFIVLNSDNTKNVFSQMRFLCAELEKYQQSAKHVFVVFHHPTHTISEFHDWGERWLFQLGFSYVMQFYKDVVTAVFVGHDHFSGFYSVGRLPLILAGGAVDLRSGHYALGRSIRAEFLNDKNRLWVKLVTKNGKATVDYIDVETQKSLFKKDLVKP